MINIIIVDFVLIEPGLLERSVLCSPYPVPVQPSAAQLNPAQRIPSILPNHVPISPVHPILPESIPKPIRPQPINFWFPQFP